MKNKSFETLYPILKALTDISDEGLLLAFHKLEAVDKAALKIEIEKALPLLDAYKEPVLPFSEISDDQINKAFKGLEERYGFVVWSNRLAGSDEDCASRVRADEEYFLGMSEDDIRVISQEAYEEDRQILKNQFSSMNVGTIIVKGTLGRWTGPQTVYGCWHNLGNVFTLSTGDKFTLYVKDGELRAENCHHDGTDRFTIYLLDPNVNPEDEQITDNSLTSIVPVLNKHYGWELIPEE